MTKITDTDKQLAQFREVAGQPVWDTWTEVNKDKFDA